MSEENLLRSLSISGHLIKEEDKIIFWRGAENWFEVDEKLFNSLKEQGLIEPYTSTKIIPVTYDLSREGFAEVRRLDKKEVSMRLLRSEEVVEALRSGAKVEKSPEAHSGIVTFSDGSKANVEGYSLNKLVEEVVLSKTKKDGMFLYALVNIRSE